MRRLFASLVCLSLMTPAFAYDDDRYTYAPPRVQDYQNQYKPQNNYSPSFQLDRQINYQNAAMQLRFGSRQGFVPSSFNLSSLSQPTLPQPKFQFADLSRTSLPEFKINFPKPQAATKPEPKGFFGSIGAGLKAVGNAFKGFVQAVGNAIAKVFTIDRAKITYEARRDQILKANPALVETSRGVFQVAPGGQFQHGGITWEPDSTFQMNDDGRGIHLSQGVTMSRDLGGIQRADGKPLPVIMTLENDRFTPTGIDYSRIEPKTKFDYTYPVTVNGLGTIAPGASMTYEGTKPGTKADPTPVILLSFQNARIDNPGKALESIANLKNEKITLMQMEVRLKGRINEINGLHVKRGEEKMFVSQHGEAFSVSQLENKTAAAAQESKALTDRSERLHRDISSAAIHTNALTGGLHAIVSTPKAGEFNVRPSVHQQTAATKAIQQKSDQVSHLLAQGNYGEVANAITELGGAQVALREEIKAQEAQLAIFQQYKHALKSMKISADSMLDNHADPDSIRGNRVSSEWVADAVPDFLEEKQNVIIQADFALQALDDMKSKGILTPLEHSLRETEVLDIRDHLLAAKVEFKHALKTEIQNKLKAHYKQVDKAADIVLFSHLDKVAESHPKTGEMIGRAGLAVTESAAIVGIGYALMTAPVPTAMALGAGIGLQKGFEAIGLSPREAAYYATLAVTVAGAATAEPQVVKVKTPRITTRVQSFFNRAVEWFKADETQLKPLERTSGHIFNFLSWGKVIKQGINPDSGITLGRGFATKDYVVTFGGKRFPSYYAAKSPTLGINGDPVWVAPMEDAARFVQRSDVVTQTGHAPGVLKSFLKGDELYGLAIRVDKVNPRQSTLADSGGYKHWRFGGFTGVEHKGSWTANPTRELVIDGGGNLPKGSILFKVNDDGSWTELRRF